MGWNCFKNIIPPLPLSIWSLLTWAPLWYGSEIDAALLGETRFHSPLERYPLPIYAYNNILLQFDAFQLKKNYRTVVLYLYDMKS